LFLVSGFWSPESGCCYYLILDTGFSILDDILIVPKIQTIEYRVSSIEHRVSSGAGNQQPATSDQWPVASNK